MKFGQRIKSEEAACLAGHRIELADHFLDYKVFLLGLVGYAVRDALQFVPRN